MEIRVKNTILRVEEDTFEIEKEGKVWKSHPSFSSNIALNSGRSVLFEMAKKIERVICEDELGKGILTRYRDLKGVNFAFDTYIWIHNNSEEIFFEWIPVNDNGFDIKEVQWPAPLVHEKGETYIPYKQGKKVLSTFTKKMQASFCSEEGSMPWIAQMDENQFGYICINETPWDAQYCISKENDMHALSIKWIPSLGKMRSRRVLRYTFKANTTIEDLCAIYRNYALELDVYTKKEENTKIEQSNIKTMNVLNYPSKGTVNKIQNADGSIEKDRLCTIKALECLKNEIHKFEDESILKVEGIVETKLDECIHPAHKMTRKECMEYRKRMLHYLKIKGKEIVVKECADWAIPYVDHILLEDEQIEGMESLDLISLVYKNNFNKI